MFGTSTKSKQLLILLGVALLQQPSFFADAFSVVIPSSPTTASTSGGVGTTDTQHVLPMSTQESPSTTALFSGFTPKSIDPRVRRGTATMLRLSTNLRIPKADTNPFSSVLRTTLQRQPRNFHENVRSIKKKATLSSLILLAHMLYYDDELVNTNQDKSDHIKSRTFTHREIHRIHRTRLSETSTFDFERREHKEFEDHEMSADEATVLETVSGLGVGEDVTTEDVAEVRTEIKTKHEEDVTNKKKAKKAQLVDIYSKSSDAGDKAYASLLELDMVELVPDPEDDDFETPTSHLEDELYDLEDDVYQEDFQSDDIEALQEEIDQVITNESVSVTDDQTEDETTPMQEPSLDKKTALIDKYSQSLDEGDRAFATLLALNMVELHDDPDDPDYDHSKDDLFAP